MPASRLCAPRRIEGREKKKKKGKEEMIRSQLRWFQYYAVSDYPPDNRPMDEQNDETNLKGGKIRGHVHSRVNDHDERDGGADAEETQRIPAN